MPGATTRHADLDWVRELAQECAPGGFDRLVRRGAAVSEEQVDALCERMYEVALSRAPEGRRESIRRVGKGQLLSWGVLKERGGEVVPTNAFLVLTGDPSMVRPLQCAIFKGESRAMFLDRRDVAGDAMAQVEGAYRYVLEKMNMGADLGGVVRRDVYELPEWSVREVITNAVAHRSYVERSSVQVALYDDRLEVSSPGGIVRGFSFDRALSGQSRPRNEALAQAFLYMGLIEGWGSGIPRVMQEFDARGLRRPEFADIDGMLRVNLWRPTNERFAAYLRGDIDGASESAAVATDSQPTATDNQPIGRASDNKDNKSDNAALINLIRRDARITQTQMAAALGVSRSTVALALKKLQDEGVIDRVGSRKAGRWIVVGESEA